MPKRKNRVSIRDSQANYEVNRDKPKSRKIFRRRADFRAEMHDLTPKSSVKESRIVSLRDYIDSRIIDVNVKRNLIAKKERELELTKKFEEFVRKKNPKNFEIVNLKTGKIDRYYSNTYMQYVKRPSISGIITFFKKPEFIRHVGAEMKYVELLIKSAKKRGISEKQLLKMTQNVENEIKKYFFQLQKNHKSNFGFRSGLAGFKFSGANFIFVGFNKDKKPKIAFIDV
jgi:protein tyrosine phosphatase